MSNVTILSKNQCVQCDSTYRAFGKKGLEKETHYSVVNMEENENAMAFAKNQLGAMQAPVVIHHEGSWEDVINDPSLIIEQWSGFRPDNISGLAATLNEVAA